MLKKIFVSILLLINISFIKAQEQGIIINEFSNGANGTKEYIEFLVVGCSGSRVDIRGWKFDDNNGDFSNGPVTSAGIAPGHSRFSMDNVWSSVPVGALILVYNDADKNPSITLPDDPTDNNTDSIYILSHSYSSLIETCNATPTTGDASYINCTTYSPGIWTTVGMRNQGDATQVRKPDGTYFHGFGWGDGTSNNTGGPDNLFFSGQGGAKAYSYTSSSCNYRDISNFSSLSAPAGETPGAPNNLSNLSYIRFLREGIKPGTISSNQTICSGGTPSTLTESGAVIRCYVNYQWQSSFTDQPGSFININGATFSTYSPPALTTTTYFRRVVTNICQHDTSNIVAITVSPNITRADPPSAVSTNLCVNPTNSTFSTSPVTNSTGYVWELIPSIAGNITGSGTTITIDWNDIYTGIAKIIVKAQGCGGNLPSDTTFITISNSQASAGTDQLNICGTNTTLSASAGNGSWSILSGTGGNFTDPNLYNSSFTGTPGETYQLQWTVPASACMNAGSDDVMISFAIIPSAPTAEDTSSCANEHATLTASGGSNGNYRWYTSNLSVISNEFNSVYSTPPLSSSSTFYVSLHNGICESARTEVNVLIQNNTLVDAGPDASIIKGESITLNGTASGSIQWSPSESLNNPTITNPIATPEITTTYILTSISAGGCIDKDSTVVYVKSLCDHVKIPNLITPNGDNKNDTFIIGCTELNWNLEISNRWGDIVYRSSHYNNEWSADGLSNGIYYFNLSSPILNVSYKGWVEVLN